VPEEEERKNRARWVKILNALVTILVCLGVVGILAVGLVLGTCFLRR
jgi:hypothetical protein